MPTIGDQADGTARPSRRGSVVTRPAVDPDSSSSLPDVGDATSHDDREASPSAGRKAPSSCAGAVLAQLRQLHPSAGGWPPDDWLSTTADHEWRASMEHLLPDSSETVLVGLAKQSSDKLARRQEAVAQSPPGAAEPELVPSAAGLCLPPDEPSTGPRTMVSAAVGAFTQVEDQLVVLQARYRRVLDAMECETLSLGDTGAPRDSLPLTQEDGVCTENPGRGHLHFARACLDDLTTALLTGPFSYLPELEQPADLLQGALRALCSTAAALHHELELRSIEHSRQKLQLTALRRQLSRRWHESVNNAASDVQAQRQNVMDQLSEQIESNMCLLEKLSIYVDQAERLSDGRSRVQSTYSQLLELTEMKRREVLMYRALLAEAFLNKDQLTTRVGNIRESIAKLIRTESLQELLEEEVVEAAESEIIHLQDTITQTKQRTEESKREIKHQVLRKNKAVQQERRLRHHTEEIVMELRRLEVLTADAEQSMEDRQRSLGTLTQHRSAVHERVQTTRIKVRKASDVLDSECLQQYEKESEAEMDISPLIKELQTLDAEVKVARERERQSRIRCQELRRRRQSATSERKQLRLEAAACYDVMTSAKADLGNIDGDHETVMTLLKEQLELADELLKMSRGKWDELHDVQLRVQADLDTVLARGDQQRNELALRKQQTSDILRDTRNEMVRALQVMHTLAENTREEAEIRDRLDDVAAEIKDGRQPALQRIKGHLTQLVERTKQLHILCDQQASLLAKKRASCSVRGQQSTTLQRKVNDMRQQRQQRQSELEQLNSLNRSQSQNITEQRHLVRALQTSYGEHSHHFSKGQLEQEEMIVMLRTWCRQVALCNGGYLIETRRMNMELAEFYDKMEGHVQEELKLAGELISEANRELERLTELHNQKHAASLERDWQLRAALLASSQAAERSVRPVQRTMVALDAERRRLLQVVKVAVRMRPFGDVHVEIEQPVCPLKEDEQAQE